MEFTENDLRDIERDRDLPRDDDAWEDELRVYDNGGASFDRYTAFLPDGLVLGIGSTGNVPNGFCMTVEAVEGPHLGKLVAFDHLPLPVQRAIEVER